MKTEEVEWEVLPPEAEKRRNRLEPLFKWMAVVMDEFLRFPGTRFRFGLDPLIGLLPGFGDIISACVSALTLIYAARCGLPRILLARMSLNILVNELVGIITGNWRRLFILVQVQCPELPVASRPPHHPRPVAQRRLGVCRGRARLSGSFGRSRPCR